MNCKNKYMKSLYSLFVTLLITLVSFGQIQDPVKWNFELGAVVENEVDLILTATIEEGWHINGANLPLESFSINSLLI